MCARQTYIRDGQNNGSIRQYRNQNVCVGCTERTSAVSTLRYCFVCLRCVVQVSMHYILCLVTLRIKVLQNGRLVKFSKHTDCKWAFSCSICHQNGHIITYIQASVSEVMTANTYHGKMSSAKRNGGRKPKLSDRDRRTLKRIVSTNHRTTTVQGTVELNIHLEDPVSTKSVQREVHKSNIHDTAQFLNLWLLKSTLTD